MERKIHTVHIVLQEKGRKKQDDTGNNKTTAAVTPT